jgi:hypothetical protein
MSGKILPENETKDEKTFTSCRKDARVLFLLLKATGETNKIYV